MAKNKEAEKTEETAQPAAAVEEAAQPEEDADEPQASTKVKKKKRPGSSPPRGKKSKKQIDGQHKKLKKAGVSELADALALLKQQKRAKFDETVEIHMSLGVDTTQSDQMLRGTVSLPHGIGKTVRILVFCQGDNEAKAKEAGADFVGSDDLVKKIQDGWTDFDIALATQDMMGKVGRLGKVLGPRGLMPTPKAGTVVTPGMDIADVIGEFKAGKVEYRTDKGGNVHAGVGKLSFDDNKLAENIMTFVNRIRSVKPSGVKGHYIRSVTICSTMSPGIPVSV